MQQYIIIYVFISIHFREIEQNRSDKLSTADSSTLPTQVSQLLHYLG